MAPGDNCNIYDAGLRTGENTSGLPFNFTYVPPMEGEIHMKKYLFPKLSACGRLLQVGSYEMITTVSMFESVFI